jgi:hypothetical protein
MEVMLAAVEVKPVWVLDASGGTDPIFRILRSEFFHCGEGRVSRLKQTNSDTSAGLSAQVVDEVRRLCEPARSQHATTLSAGLGWENLYLARSDELNMTAEGGNHFPFGSAGLDVLDVDLHEITRQIDSAESFYKTDQMASLVHSWDAIRALSRRPWANRNLDSATALQWLRAWKFWGGTMSWLGLFGHSSAAAVMVSRSALALANRFDLPETRPGGPFAADKHFGGLGSSHFSLSKAAPSPQVRADARKKGIQYCTRGLESTSDPRSQAGLLAVRGILRLSGGIRGALGLLDLHLSESKHLAAAKGNGADAGLATARVQVGAAYKEIAKRLPAKKSALRVAEERLRNALDVLEGGMNSDPLSNGGQVLMCMKHLIETYSLQERDVQARDLWAQANALARQWSMADQHRQLIEFAKARGWD